MRRRRNYFLFTFLATLIHFNEGIGVIKLTVPFNTNQEIVLNSTVEYILEFYQTDEDLLGYPSRVQFVSEDANTLYPVLISARHNNGAGMWQLPYVTRSDGHLTSYPMIQRTMCPHNNVMMPPGNESLSCDNDSQKTTVIHLSTTCATNVRVQVLVEAAQHFYLSLYETVTVEVAPNTPSYFFYSFEYGALAARVDLSSIRAAWLEACGRSVTSEQHKQAAMMRETLETQYPPPRVRLVVYSDDDICATVSIQNYACPVFDSEREILYEGLFMTMSQNSSIQLTRAKYPYGFYVVLIVKESNEDCVGHTISEAVNIIDAISWEKTVIKARSDDTSRLKTISFRIEPTISYWQYATATSVVLGFFIAFYLVFLLIVLILRTKWAKSYFRKGTFIDSHREAESIATETAGNESDSSSSTPRHQTNISATNGEQQPQALFVAQLSKHSTRMLIARAQRYMWTVITVAAFYTLPVVQLVVMFQVIFNASGNQDMCYYNFLCANPLGALADFNHIFSNIGYILLGALFVIQVARRQNRQKYKIDIEDHGLPPQYGLLYSLGFSLMVVGILSASYHLCPNQMNFQFDTAFMYVTSVLCLVKIYQTRHPDLTARAHLTFGILAGIISLGFFGVALNGNIFWVVFTMLHIGFFFFLSLQLYYVGNYTTLSSLPIVEAARTIRTGGTRSIVAAVRPKYKPRLYLILFANVVNWVYAIYGLWKQSDDFASHMLMLLLMNLAIYTISYIILKLLHRERIIPHAWAFIIVAFCAWPPALYFFVSGPTNWAATPATSRTLNMDCNMFEFYDSHDIWHFLSAIAMFASFNMLLTWDDGLTSTPRHLINVF